MKSFFVAPIVWACVMPSCEPRCLSPDCGEFLAAIVAEPTPPHNCSVAKILTRGNIEYLQPVVGLCEDAQRVRLGGDADANNDGDGEAPSAVTAQDKGFTQHGTGNGSYLFYTSGSGNFVHQVFMDKGNEAPQVSIKAKLPSNYTRVLGMHQLGHPGNLYVITRTELLATSPSATGPPSLTRVRSPETLKPVASLTHLNLSSATVVAGSDGAACVFALDSWTLHEFRVQQNGSSSSTSNQGTGTTGSLSQSSCDIRTVPLTPPALLTDAKALAAGFVDDKEVIVVLLDSHTLVTIDPASGVVVPINASVSPTFNLTGLGALGTGREFFYVDDSPALSTVYLDLDDNTGAASACCCFAH